MPSTLRQHRRHILRGILDVLDSHHAPEQDVFGAVCDTRRHDSRTIYQIDSLHERDVLPYFSFAGYGRGGADFLFAECVDDAGFAGVRVADEADGDLFAVAMEAGELAEEGDEGAFAEGVG